MKSLLVISSFVAGSNVGGSLAMKVLPLLGMEVNLLPTTLLGRHPGWGAPGGGAVPQALFDGMAAGLAANDLPSRSDAVVTGYFATADQVRSAARLISDHFSGRAPVIVDPIMGDTDKGLYVKEDVAAAIVAELLPLADAITPNVFEFYEIERRLGHGILDAEGLPERTGIRAQLAHNKAPYTRFVTSVHDSGHVGIMMQAGQEIDFAARPLIKEKVPSGTGDLAALMIAGACIDGRWSQKVLDSLVGRVHSAIHTDRRGELAIAGIRGQAI